MTSYLEAADQSIGLVTCRSRSGGSNPHQVRAEIAPEHSIAAAAASGQAINFCVEQRLGAAHPLLIELVGEPQDSIVDLRANGFTPIEIAHELGMSVL